MQLSAMPPTVFKTKWNLFQKLSPKHEHVQTRRRSSSSEDDNQKRRKYSDAMSVGTCESTTSMADKFRQAIPFLRRRSSSNMSSLNHMSSPPPTIVEVVPHQVKTTIVSDEFCQQLDKLQSLYTLAVDELNYAEDSQGSSYYSGDLTTAREALNDCAKAFIRLLQQTTDPLTREGLQSSMAPKLLKLQRKLDSLPEPTEETD